MQLRRETDSGVIFVTHDLGVVADIADRVIVMYGGRVVEQGTLDEIFYDPQHPYTWGLLGSVTRMDREPPRRLPAIPGQPPSLLRPPQGLPLPPPLPARVRALHRGARRSSRHLADAPEHTGPLLAVGRGQARRCATVDGRIGLDTGADRRERGDRDRPAPRDRATGTPLIEVEHLKLHFPVKQGS